MCKNIDGSQIQSKYSRAAHGDGSQIQKAYSGPLRRAANQDCSAPGGWTSCTHAKSYPRQEVALQVVPLTGRTRD